MLKGWVSTTAKVTTFSNTPHYPAAYGHSKWVGAAALGRLSAQRLRYGHPYVHGKCWSKADINEQGYCKLMASIGCLQWLIFSPLDQSN